MRHLAGIAVVLIWVGACGSSSSGSAPADAGPADAGGEADDSGGAAGHSAADSEAPDGEADAAPEAAVDSGPNTAWQLETDVLVKTASAVQALLADPKVARHLIVILQNNAQLATEWSNGQLVYPLVSENPSAFSPYFQGGGFDGDGNAYLYWSGLGNGPNSSPFSIAYRAAGASYAWRDVPSVLYVNPMPASWPPIAMAVDPTSPGRVFLDREDDWLLDVTAAVGDQFFGGAKSYLATGATATPPLTAFAGLVFSPTQHGDFLVRTADGPRLCHLGAGIACDATATGLAPGETVSALSFSANGAVYAAVENQKLYRSSDSGASFTATSVPNPTRTFTKLAVAATKDRLALYYPFASDDDGGTIWDELQVSSDGGVSWQKLAFPDTPTTDFDDMVFDAAGTLFIARGGRLFSLPSF